MNGNTTLSIKLSGGCVTARACVPTSENGTQACSDDAEVNRSFLWAQIQPITSELVGWYVNIQDDYNNDNINSLNLYSTFQETKGCMCQRGQKEKRK